jgi:hypothetical protein
VFSACALKILYTTDSTRNAIDHNGILHPGTHLLSKPFSIDAPLPNETRRANQIAQLECRLGAEAAKILPRDRTAYIIKCLADDGQKPAERQ